MSLRMRGAVAVLVSLSALGAACGSSFGDMNDACAGSECDGGERAGSGRSDAGATDATLEMTAADAMAVGAGDDGSGGGGGNGDANEGDDDAGPDDPSDPSDAPYLGPNEAGAAGTCGASTYCALVLANSPLAYFRFNEASPNDAYDWSTNGHTVSFEGPATTGSPSLADVDGGKGVQLGNALDAGTLGSACTFNLFDKNGAATPLFAAHSHFTIEYWFAVPSTKAVADIASFTNFATDSASNDNGIDLVTSRQSRSDFSALFVWPGKGHTSVFAEGPYALPRGAYHHVAATYDGTSLRVYADGNPGTPVASTGSGSAGGYHAVALFGLLDELAFYPSALSDTEIRKHANYVP